MDISCVVKILMLVVLMNLSMLDVDAMFNTTSNSTKSGNSTPPTKSTTWTKQYYISVRIINVSQRQAILLTNFTGVLQATRLSSFGLGSTYEFADTLLNPAIYSVRAWARDSQTNKLLFVHNVQNLLIRTSETQGRRRVFNITEQMTVRTTAITTTVRSTTETSTKPAVKTETSTSLPTTAEHNSVAVNGSTSKSKTTTETTYKHDEHEHKLLFYISIGLGSALGILLFCLIIIPVRRFLRKRKENKERAVHWAKINRTCQSQYIPNEEVSTNNPMYEGSRSRTTSNVLYGVPDEEDITSKFSHKNNYVPSPPAQQSPKPDLVTSNACALYQNADDLYSEPKKTPEGVENGNYERIKSFIVNQRNEVRESTGSYAEPSVLFNGMFVTENTGYVSAVHKK